MKIINKNSIKESSATYFDFSSLDRLKNSILMSFAPDSVQYEKNIKIIVKDSKADSVGTLFAPKLRLVQDITLYGQNYDFKLDLQLVIETSWKDNRAISYFTYTVIVKTPRKSYSDRGSFSM